MLWWTKMLRWMGLAKPAPPATTAGTSILFVLQSKSPMSLQEISSATRIPISDLWRVMDEMVENRRILATILYEELRPYKVYWINHDHKGDLKC